MKTIISCSGATAIHDNKHIGHYCSDLQTDNHGDQDLGGKSTCCHFKPWAISFTPLCLKAVGPFYLVSMPGEEKDPTSGIENLLWTPRANALTAARKLAKWIQSDETLMS